VVQCVAAWCRVVLRVVVHGVEGLRSSGRYVLECCTVLQCVECVAVCCSVLQCVAMCCSVLQCVAVGCSVLQSVAVWCSAGACSCGVWRCRVLQCYAVRCIVWQFVVAQATERLGVTGRYVLVRCSVVQCGAVWCSVVQCGAVLCSVVLCVAVGGSVGCRGTRH